MATNDRVPGPRRPSIPIRDDAYEAAMAGSLSARGLLTSLAETFETRDLRSVFFVGLGSSFFNIAPAWYVLDKFSAYFPAFLKTSADFVARPPALVGPTSLVVVLSTGGTTPESIAAAQSALARGATVLTISTAQEIISPGGNVRHVKLPSAEIVAAPACSFGLQLAYCLLQQTGTEVGTDYKSLWSGFESLPRALTSGIRRADDEYLSDIAGDIAHADITQVLAGGPNLAALSGARRSFLTEPRIIEPEHSQSEAVQGVFETFDEETGYLVFVGEDDTRDHALSVASFIAARSLHSNVIDSLRCPLPGVDSDVRGHLTPILIAALSQRLAQHVEHQSGYQATDY